jgi:hypothetical protein
VLRHPVARAHFSFCKTILSTGPGSFSKIRRTLRNRFKLPIPQQMPDEAYTVVSHREAFKAYLKFVKANLAGQTAIRQDAHWATQASVVAGFAGHMMPDLVLRESELTTGLAELGTKIGRQKLPEFQVEAPETPFALADIYDAEIEAMCKDIYQRDYTVFGFSGWV